MSQHVNTNHCKVCQGRGCYWCGNIRTIPHEKLDVMKCGICAGHGALTQCDGVGGKWQERCVQCRGSGTVTVVVDVSHKPCSSLQCAITDQCSGYAILQNLQRTQRDKR